MFICTILNYRKAVKLSAGRGGARGQASHWGPRGQPMFTKARQEVILVTGRERQRGEREKLRPPCFSLRFSSIRVIVWHKVQIICITLVIKNVHIWHIRLLTTRCNFTLHSLRQTSGFSWLPWSPACQPHHSSSWWIWDLLRRRTHRRKEKGGKNQILKGISVWVCVCVWALSPCVAVCSSLSHFS